MSMSYAPMQQNILIVSNFVFRSGQRKEFLFWISFAYLEFLNYFSIKYIWMRINNI